MLPLENLQNRKRRKRRKSARFGFSEANAVLFAEPHAVAASLLTGIAKNVVDEQAQIKFLLRQKFTEIQFPIHLQWPVV